MMKGDNNDAAVLDNDTTSFCACCGIAEIDDVKLKECADCDLVRYCSDECQKDHESEHDGECKKRAAELRDELLFKQPERIYREDCPICLIPLPINNKKTVMFDCCSKIVCNGCDHANWMRNNELRRLQHSCPFCRVVFPETDEETDKQRAKRVEANDPVAIRREGKYQCNKGDYQRAFDFFTRAADLGDVDAHCSLSNLYHKGKGVEKDWGKKIYHLEEAAIGGNAAARFTLGAFEWNNGDYDRAVKYWIISATQGHDRSIKALMDKAYKAGFVEKEVLADALRAHQAAVDATKSPQREAAEEAD